MRPIGRLEFRKELARPLDPGMDDEVLRRAPERLLEGAGEMVGAVAGGAGEVGDAPGAAGLVADQGGGLERRLAPACRRSRARQIRPRQVELHQQALEQMIGDGGLQRPPPGILRRHRLQMADDLPQQALAIDRVDRMQLGRQGIFRHAPPRPAVVKVEMDEAHAEPVARSCSP